MFYIKYTYVYIYYLDFGSQGRTHSKHFFLIFHIIETLFTMFHYITLYWILITVLVNIITFILYMGKWSTVRACALPKIAEVVKELDLKFKSSVAHTGHSLRLLIYIWEERADWQSTCINWLTGLNVLKI